jgi:phosphoglycolate phosphatase
LFDDVTLCVAIINDMLAKRRLSPITVEEYRDVFTFPVRTYYSQVGFDLDSESFEALSEEFHETYEASRHGCALHSSTGAVLEQVAASGKSQSILSAYEHERLLSLIQDRGLGAYFEHLIGLDNVLARSKVQQGRQLLAMLPHSPADVLLVGDTLHDAEVAETLGTDCVLVAHGHQSKSRLEQSGVPVINTLQELHSIL